MPSEMKENAVGNEGKYGENGDFEVKMGDATGGSGEISVY